MEKKNICIVSAEAVPFVKAGGMADVVGSLYKYLRKEHNVYLFIPFYKALANRFRTENEEEIEVDFGEGRKEKGTIARSLEYPGVYFIGRQEYFDREELYGPGGTDYPDNAERFSFFAKGVLEAVKKSGIRMDVFHCHDWHTALLPLYVKESCCGSFQDARTLFTIHNLGYQGIFPQEKFSILGLPWKYFSMEELEFYGSVNFMKAGIIHSDAINTVSPRYSVEILTEEFGNRLEGLLKKVSGKVSGIINGVDYTVWNPSFDGYIKKKYRTYKGKGANKESLQEELGLAKEQDIQLFGMVTRLAEQKGIDMLLEIMETLIGKNVQFAVLGDGSAFYKDALGSLHKKFPANVSATFGFNEGLAHRIYAGSDFFLMPSRFEPCGLGQLISFKYGTIPVVRKVGGLADSVEEYDFETGKGSGFTFDGGSRELMACIEKALRLFIDRKSLASLSEHDMKLDFSWKASVGKYLELYGELANI